jgi:uncharacterized membrane protein/pimeloyl-ACP methyl ester carboxylesterase
VASQSYIVIDLGTLPDCGYSQANSINQLAQVAGVACTFINGSFVQRAFLWDKAHGLRDLGTLPGDIGSYAERIDDAGRVGGYSFDGEGNQRNFIYTDLDGDGQIDAGEMQEGTLSGPWIPDVSSYFDPQIAYTVIATDVNDSGDVVGSYCPDYGCVGGRHGFLVSGGAAYDLGTLGSDTYAAAINNYGQIVGNGRTAPPSYAQRALLWVNSALSDVNDLLGPNSSWVLNVATDVNDSGEIVGWGTINGESHAFLLSLFRLVDAQGFQPQLDQDGGAYLTSPITALVDSSFVRVGALTDGASLIVIQFASGANLDGWTVSLVDTNTSDYGVAELGSLWHGNESDLPPLPVTTTDLGSAALTLSANETAIFYRAAPSWAFGTSNKTRDIQIQVFDESTNLVAAVPFSLHKPPLVLVHGLFGSANSWNGFRNRITAAGFVVDKATADYSDRNTSGFDGIFTAVPEAIRAAVNTLRDAGIAATRVDVVAHSMGTDATRWYMTPSADLPANADRGDNSVEPLLFRTPAISASRVDEDRFQREDNFGIGDIRRFVTLGGVHTGTSICWQGIRMVNKGIRAELEQRKDHLKIVTLVERIFGFNAIPFDEPGNPGDAGMALVDLAAGTHTYPNGTAPPTVCRPNCASARASPVCSCGGHRIWRFTFERRRR